MFKIPLHKLSEKEKLELAGIIQSEPKPNELFCVENNEYIYFFLHKSSLDNYINFNHAEFQEFKVVQINDIVFDKKIIFEPCTECIFKGYLCENTNQLLEAISEYIILEKNLFNMCKTLFEKQDINKLYTCVRSLLEHYSSTHALTHFYLGFCFHTFNDQENYLTSLSKLKNLDAQLYNQLQKLA